MAKCIILFQLYIPFTVGQYYIPMLITEFCSLIFTTFHELRHMFVSQSHLFNFEVTERPVPLEIEVRGFSGKRFYNRAAAMNKSIFQSKYSIIVLLIITRKKVG